MAGNIEVIGKLKPKNNGPFKIADAVDIDFDGNGTSLLDAIKSGAYKGDPGQGIYVATINIGTDTAFNKTDVINGVSIRAHDLVIDNGGDVYEVQSITDTQATPGAVIFNLKGPKGDTGDDGAQGAPGARGSTWRTTTADPGATDGFQTGDVTVNTVTWHLWIFDGKAWQDQGSIQGAAGTNGKDGAAGAKGDPGAPFTIAKVYASVDEMNADYTNADIAQGAFVVITTGNVEDEDNAKLYVKGAKAYEFITDMSGAQGLTGPQGAAGAPGAAGKDGAQGPQGLSAFQVWQAQDGNADKTMADYLDAIKGAKGDTGATGAPGAAGKDGAQGLSAFQVWQAQDGNADKTMADYLASLKGDKGDKGDQGDPGLALDDASTTATDKGWSAKKINDSIAAVDTKIGTPVDLVQVFETELAKTDDNAGN